RIAYRWHRLWLTPLFRVTVRVGLPGFAVAFGAGLWLADEANRGMLTAGLDELRTEFEQRPAFMVGLMTIEGASPLLATAVREALDLRLPVSSFALDLPAIRARVEAFDAVLSADVLVAPGGVLTVRVTERQPAALWRGPDGLVLIDAGGHRIAAVDHRALRPDLPLLTGEGAPDAVGEALALVAAAGPLAHRIVGLVRVGQRRWDVVLDRGQRLMLPAAGAGRALDRIIALDAAEALLARDIVAVDLRLPHRPTLRLTPAAAETLRQTRQAQAERANL
ncbi:MAG: cell division protein FtsQ/DivIB, partial [Gemmobacter sp.]